MAEAIGESVSRNDQRRSEKVGHSFQLDSQVDLVIVSIRRYLGAVQLLTDVLIKGCCNSHRLPSFLKQGRPQRPALFVWSGGSVEREHDSVFGEVVEVALAD